MKKRNQKKLCLGIGFLVAFLLVAAIVFLVVTVGSFRAATENPVNSLKSE